MADRKSTEELNDLVDEITMDAYNDDEQLWAFRQVFEDEVAMPAEAFLVGELVEVLTIDYDGNERRGLTARCRNHGSLYTVAAQDLVFPDGSNPSHFIASYRVWLGIEPYPHVKKRPKACEDDLDIRKSVELVALAVRPRAVSCRILGEDLALTIRSSGYTEIAPGEIITVSPRKKWLYRGHLCLAGEITASRTDIPALGLAPLTLREMGMWDPKEHYWGEPDEPKEPWTRPIIKRGIRPEYEMGVKIGELSLGKDFTGLLPWGCVDNRPFLRCLFGYGLCLWRFARLRDAEKVFTRVLWLNPTDNQGARFNLSDVKQGKTWHE
jgi:hypothetical protein